MIQQVIRQFQSLWSEHSAKASMLRASLLSLEKVLEEKGGEKVLHQVQSLSSFGNSKKPYVPLMQVIIILVYPYDVPINDVTLLD